jgi:threonine dehydrogenase-like Zn-dependent dehydrogenase
MVIEDVSGPGPARAGNVIVRPEAVGICGSDFHLFSGDVANRAALAALFSHHFPLTRAGEAFEFAMKRPPDAIKIVVTVN